ncbi:MAG: rRNA maturation RNase YbeY [Patescibacteria group bacterium]|jgi:probable rRNA maturation factor
MLEINNTTKERINAKRLEDIADKFARAYKKKSDVSLAIVGPARIKSLNRDYRGLDKATDVLSFTEENEVIINIADTKSYRKYQEMFLEIGMDISVLKSAVQKKRLSEYLLYFLFVHGLLHLAGYDDKTEAGRLEMVRKGRGFLKKIGLVL